MNRRRTGPLEGEVAFSGFQWPLKAKSPSDFRLSKADSEEPSTLEGRVGKNPEGLSRSFQLFETLNKAQKKITSFYSKKEESQQEKKTQN